jgi:hypothetical protein
MKHTFKFRNLFLILLVILFAGNVFAASISSVSFDPTSSWVTADTNIYITVYFSGWARVNVNDMFATSYETGVGYIKWFYTVRSGHDNHAVDKIPFLVEVCDNEAMNSGCVTSSTSSNGTPGIDTLAPVDGSITIAGGDTYTNSATPTLSLYASDGIGVGVAKMSFSCDGSTWHDVNNDLPNYATSYSSFNMTTGSGCSTSEVLKQFM